MAWEVGCPILTPRGPSNSLVSGLEKWRDRPVNLDCWRVGFLSILFEDAILLKWTLIGYAPAEATVACLQHA